MCSNCVVVAVMLLLSCIAALISYTLDTTIFPSLKNHSADETLI